MLYVGRAKAVVGQVDCTCDVFKTPMLGGLDLASGKSAFSLRTGVLSPRRPLSSIHLSGGQCNANLCPRKPRH